MGFVLSQIRLTSFVCSGVLLLALAGCGGSSHSPSPSSSNSSIAGATATNSGTPATSSGAAPSPVTNSGGASSGVTSGSTGASSGSNGTFVYSAIYTDGGGIAGYNLDSNGTLSGVNGSPYIQQGIGGSGALAIHNGYVYMANIANSTNYRTQFVRYKADTATGAQTSEGTSDAGVGANGDSGLRKLLVNSSGKAMYGVFQHTIISYGFSSGGTPSVLNTTEPSTDAVWGFDVMPHGPYAYAAIQNGNPKQGFQAPQIVLLNVNRDGSVTTNRPLLTLNNASGIAGDLKVDPSGKFVVVSTGQSNNQLSVYAIQADGSLSEVAGSPFSTGSQELRYMAFDSTGLFLYAVNQQDAQPQAEDVEVFSFSASSGALTQVQEINQPNEQNVTWLTADGNFVYLTNVSGGTNSTVTVFSQDPNTGQLTEVSSQAVPEAIGQTVVAHF